MKLKLTRASNVGKLTLLIGLLLLAPLLCFPSIPRTRALPPRF